MDQVRAWTILLDDAEHRVEVVYAGLSGWMTMFVDGRRCARGWREFQTAFGGARLACAIGDHRLDARITQTFGSQDYRFALSVDGVLQPGSDDMPSTRTLYRRSAAGIGWVAATVSIMTFLVNGLWPFAIAVAAVILVLALTQRSPSEPPSTR
jgi:hypothetical protein